MNELGEFVQAWARRARIQHSLQWVLAGLAIGLFVALLVAVSARIWPLMSTPTLIAIATASALLGVLLAAGWPWLRHWRTPHLVWARQFDRQFGLRQRVSTALEVDAGTLAIKNSAIRSQQQQDAVRLAEAVDARKLLPLRLSLRDGLVALVLGLGLILAIALPNPQQQILAQQAAFRDNLAQQIKQIEEAKRAIEQSQSLTEAQKKQALQALNEAQKALADPNATPEQALAALNDAQAKLDALRDQAAEQMNQDLQQAGNTMSADELTNALANSLSKQDFGKAASQMRSLSTKDGKALSQEEMQRVANQLDQMARDVQKSDAAMAQQLRDAAQQMRQGNAEQARQSLNQAANGLDRASNTQQSQQSLNEAQARAEAARQSVAQSSKTAQTQNNAQSGQQNQNGQQQGQNGQSSQSSQANQSGQAGQAGQSGQNGEQGANGEQGGAQGQSGSADGQNSDGQQGQAQGQSGGMAEGASQQAGHSEDVGSENNVYAPSRVNAQGKQVVLDDQKGETATDPSGRQNTAPGGNSSVPYQQVYGDYSKTADEALKSDEVPAGLRDYVRDYFSSLDPKQDK